MKAARGLKANHAKIPALAMRKTLNVAQSGHCDWLKRAASAQAQANAVLLESIRQAPVASDITCGPPRTQAEVTPQGIKVGHNRIAA